MAECHFWWRAGDTQWCDMRGEACQCNGWEECCDLKKAKNRNPQARLVAKIGPAGIHRGQRAGQRKLRRSA